MSPTKKTRAQKAVSEVAIVHTRDSVFASAKHLQKTTILAFMFKHKICVPRMLSLTSTELMRAIEVMIRCRCKAMSWPDVYDELMKADHMHTEAVDLWKETINELSTDNAARFVNHILPKIAKWKLSVRWGALACFEIVDLYYSNDGKSMVFKDNANRERSFTGVCRFVDYKYMIGDSYEFIMNDGSSKYMQFKMSENILESTDRNVELFRVLNIKNTSKRPLVLPPLLVTLIMNYTRVLLLKECNETPPHIKT